MSKVITNQQFIKRMSAAELWLDNCESTEESEYLYAYRFGLRRHYHGERFGTDAEVSAFRKRGGVSREGLEAGLAAAMCDVGRFRSQCYGQNVEEAQ